MGSGVASLGRSVFNQCDALDTIVVMPLVPPSVEPTTFNNTSQGMVFVVPCGRVEDYRSAWGSGLAFAEPQPELTLTLDVNDTLCGTVSMGDGVGCDSTAVVAASPFRGYRFERWSNGRTVNPDTLYLTGDSVLTAFFEPQLYTVDVQVNDEGWGMATGSGVYEYGTDAELAATALAGYVSTTRAGCGWKAILFLWLSSPQRVQWKRLRGRSGSACMPNGSMTMLRL